MQKPSYQSKNRTYIIHIRCMPTSQSETNSNGPRKNTNQSFERSCSPSHLPHPIQIQIHHNQNISNLSSLRSFNRTLRRVSTCYSHHCWLAVLVEGIQILECPRRSCCT